MYSVFLVLDRFVIEHIGSTSKNKDHAVPISLLAVFDGHGGSAASQFCSDWMSSYIRKKNDHYPHNLPMAVQTAFSKVCVYNMRITPFPSRANSMLLPLDVD